MQDATVFAWASRPPLRGDIWASLRELNRRFLALTAQGSGAASGAPLTVLSETQRHAAADCPYALFDLRWHDADHWARRLERPFELKIADAPRADHATVEFTRLALFFAWHVANAAPLAAPLVLGVHEATALGLARLTLDSLPDLAFLEAPNLRSRWQHCAAYWGALVHAASLPGAAALRRVQLGGIQLAAAARLAGGPIALEAIAGAPS